MPSSPASPRKLSYFPQRPPSAVYVEKGELLDGLLEPTSLIDESGYGIRAESSVMSAGGRSHSSRSVHSSKSKAVSINASQKRQQIQLSRLEQVRTKFALDQAKKDHATKQAIARGLIAKREKEEKDFQDRLADIEQARKFLDTIDHSLTLQAETHHNKVRRQFEDWNTNVHGVIQKKIAKQIDSMSSKDLNKQKNEDFDKFIEITNRKPAIFRDIIIESEYDPLSPNRRAIKAKTAMLKDPTLMQIRKVSFFLLLPSFVFLFIYVFSLSLTLLSPHSLI